MNDVKHLVWKWKRDAWVWRLWAQQGFRLDVPVVLKRGIYSPGKIYYGWWIDERFMLRKVHMLEAVRLAANTKAGGWQR